MFRRASSGPSHWSKDFVEHLRSVHFALIGASTAVILVAASVKSYNPVTAVRQVSEIIELQKLWSPNFVLQRVRPLSEQTPALTQRTNPEDDVDFIDPFLLGADTDKGGFGILGTVEWTGEHHKNPMRVVFVFPELMLMDGKNWQMQGRAWTPHGDPAKTLADFRWWWDGLLESPTVLIPERFSRTATLARTPTREYSRRTLPMTRLPIASTPAEALRLRRPLEKFQKSLYSSGYAFLGRLDTASAFDPSLPRIQLLLSGTPSDLEYMGSLNEKDSTVSVTIPINYVQVQLTQQELVKLFPNWQLGHFDRSFLDLAQAAKGLEALELEDVERIVSEDAVRGSEVLEVFGFKFPVARVTVWTTVVLFSIQLYLLVYLKQLSGKLGRTDAGWDVPWIGMDQSRLARSLLFVTITLLPCMSLAFWGVRTFQQLNWFAVVNGLGFIGSLIFGVWCWKYRPQPKHSISGAAAERDS